jgi:hypothetical protein
LVSAIKGYKLTRQEIRGLVSDPLSEDTDLLKKALMARMMANLELLHLL